MANLHEAAKFGDIEALDHLMAEGQEINEKVSVHACIDA
jgi:hypothetical protein